MSGKSGGAAPTDSSDPTGAAITEKEHIMRTHHRLDPATVVAPSDQLTNASAWSSSQLGDPQFDDGYLSDSDVDGTDPVSKPQSAAKIALIAVAAAGAIGAGVVLGSVFFGGESSQPTGVVPGARTGSVIPNAPGTVPPAAVPVPTAVMPLPDPGQAPVTSGTGGGAPVAGDNGAPAAAGPADAPPATDPTDGGSVPAPQAGPGYAPGAPNGPVVVVSPNLNMPGGRGHPGTGGPTATNGGGAQTGGATSGGATAGGGAGSNNGSQTGGATSGGATAGGGAGSNNIPHIPPQQVIHLPPGIHPWVSSTHEWGRAFEPGLARVSHRRPGATATPRVRW